MRRQTPRSRRRAFRVEALEPRALMAVTNPGMATDLFVRFSSTASPAAEKSALASVHATVLQVYADGPEFVTVDKASNLASAVKRLEAYPIVVYATPDTTIHTEAAVYPNDPLFDQDPGLNTSNNVDIDAPEAWGVTTGTSATIVAVIDTGIDLNNADFAGKIWTNPNPNADAGYPDDVHGWNFVSDNNDVQDDNGHGSHVAGIIAAAGNNAYGVVGVDWNATIMPLKFLDSNGNGDTDNAVAAIYYAVNHGATVINASWGGVGISEPLYDAINYANAHNVVFITAAGNDGTNNDQLPSYPASYRLPNELNVATVNQDGTLASFSNYGPTTVDLAAPGVNVISDVPTSIDPSGFEVLSGTSMSTAYVSGVAALIEGLDPGLTAAQIVQRIETTTKPIPDLVGKVITGGIVDAYNAITNNGVPINVKVIAAGIPSLTPGGSTDAQVRSSILASDEFFYDHGSTAEGFVTGLYEDVFGREPDAGGLAYWEGVYNSGTSTRYQIADAIVSSPEGRLNEVAHFYQDDLGRTTAIAALEADAGVAYWASLLVAGVGDADVQAAIMASPEYLIDHGASPDPVVVGLYQDLYDRSPDTTDDAAWAGLLYEGFAPDTVIRFFQGTAEAEQTLVAGWFASDLGRQETVAQLKSDPGVDGFAGFLGNL